MPYQRLYCALFLALMLVSPAFGQENGGGLVNRMFPNGQELSAGNGTSVPAENTKMYATPAAALLPPLLPVPDYISKKSVNLNSKERRALRLAGKWRDRKINPVMHDNGKVMYVYGATLPTIICSPLMASDLELQEGEIVNDVIVGDTARWIVVVGRSGMSGRQQTHIVVKPMDAGLVTTAVITTDRRTYHLKLISRRSGYTPYVGFIYPEDQKAAMLRSLERKRQQQNWQSTESVTGKQLDLTKLDFAYTMKGDAPWKPLQIYNDGTRTVIRLPFQAAQTELPVLLVEKSGASVLVNYRVRRNSLVVDEVFDKAMLIAGVGNNQEKVEITKVKEE